MQERLPLLIFLMVCLMTVAYSTIGIYTPAMPAIAAHFGATMGQVQLTFSTYLIAFSFGQLLYGPLSDRHGRRPAIFVGLAIYVVGSAMSALAVSIEMLIVARAVQALGGCAGPVLARAIMRDLFRSRRRGALDGLRRDGDGRGACLRARVRRVFAGCVRVGIDFLGAHGRWCRGVGAVRSFAERNASGSRPSRQRRHLNDADGLSAVDAIAAFHGLHLERRFRDGDDLRLRRDGAVHLDRVAEHSA